MKMKKFLILLFLCIFSPSIFFINGWGKNSKKIIKRKILILPFQNINEVNKYKFLSTSLRDALNGELLDSNLYIILSFSEINNKIQQMSINEKDVTNENNANKLAIKMKADVIIIGTYIILNDKIKLQMKAIDVHEKQTIISINTQGDADLDIFRIIDESVKDMAQKMHEKLPLSRSASQSDIEKDLEEVREFIEEGYKIIKVKVGLLSPKGDICRINAIRETVGPDVSLRADANHSGKNATRSVLREALITFFMEFLSK